MATSQILAIYDALAAVTVSDGVTAIAAYDVDEQPDQLTTAQAPVRLLTVFDPLQGQQRTRGDVWAASQGSGYYTVTWVLFDVMYHTPMNQGRGVRDVNAKLLTYMANYYAMLAAMEADDMPTGINKVAVAMAPIVLDYPRGSGHSFRAVRVQLDIQEAICPT